eukprot:TRINITY_DN7575_c3_g1_i2.p1 TRINITY_DN7575_c3_g1~~TRINITY_DN7575_c3_g1_i2.p1  ORF type:complete len:331 (+),score=74.23 TRINITY_DN7575_c3_g1_i2:137-1129(+)
MHSSESSGYDSEYEFDAPHYFDFSSLNSEGDCRADSWFGSHFSLFQADGSVETGDPNTKVQNRPVRQTENNVHAKASYDPIINSTQTKSTTAVTQSKPANSSLKNNSKVHTQSYQQQQTQTQSRSHQQTTETTARRVPTNTPSTKAPMVLSVPSSGLRSYERPTASSLRRNEVLRQERINKETGALTNASTLSRPMVVSTNTAGTSGRTGTRNNMTEGKENESSRRLPPTTQAHFKQQQQQQQQIQLHQQHQQHTQQPSQQPQQPPQQYQQSHQQRAQQQPPPQQPHLPQKSLSNRILTQPEPPSFVIREQQKKQLNQQQQKPFKSTNRK